MYIIYINNTLPLATDLYMKLYTELGRLCMDEKKMDEKKMDEKKMDEKKMDKKKMDKKKMMMNE